MDRQGYAEAADVGMRVLLMIGIGIGLGAGFLIFVVGGWIVRHLSLVWH